MGRKRERRMLCFVIVLIIFLFIIIFRVQYISGDVPCFAKPCEIQGNNCLCCLITIGTIRCFPCGQVDCQPPK